MFDGYYVPTDDEIDKMHERAQEMHRARKYQGVEYKTEKELITAFISWVGERAKEGGVKRLTPCGHNVCGFDMPFLKARAEHFKITMYSFDYHCIDTMVALAILEDAKGYSFASKSLGKACEQLKVYTEGDLHNAKTDTQLAIKLYEKYLEQL